MRLKFLTYILFPILFVSSLFAKADDKNSGFFNEQIIFKKGITLSELGLIGNKNVKIRHSDAMRYDAAYIPTGSLDGGKPFNMPIAEIQKNVARAHAALQSVEDNQAFITLLDGKNINLPIGIKRTVGNQDITVCLDSIIFTPTYAYAVLYVILEDTKNNQTLAFMGRDIRFTKDGGFTGDAQLQLLQTYDMAYGPNTTISFLVDALHSNYVVFNCDGFKQLHVEARTSFSRNIFVPEQSDGTIAPAPATVSAEFITDFESLDDWMVQIANVPKFQVVGLEGLSFQIGSLAFDYSSTANPSGIVFPSGYSDASLTAGNNNLWEGFYVKNLNITLPQQFKIRSTESRIVLSVENALIDKLGFTGRVSVSNLLPLTEGDMSSWQYSVDYLALDIQKSTPVGASFSGSLVVPITKNTEQFGYAANFLPQGNFNFTISTKTTISFPLWGAGSVTINPDSWIQVGTVNHQFVPKASLTGQLNITATINSSEGDDDVSDKNSNLSLAKITFTKLLIQTISPYISLDPNGGAVSFGSDAANQKCTNLPVTISNLGMVTQDNGNSLGFSFTLIVNITGEQDAGGGFGGSAGIIVWGKKGTGISWQYSHTELDEIEVRASIAIIDIDAQLIFFRADPIYGSGFAAKLDLTINLSATKIAIKSKAIFGKKDLPTDPNNIYRYFALDALVELPVVITLYPPILFLNAFGGGASYKMNLSTSTPPANAKFVSSSGIAYVPDDSKGLGLKAIVGIQGDTRQIYDGQITFEVIFNSGGGLSMIGFSGYVQIASLGTSDKLAKVASSVSGMVAKAKVAEAAVGSVVNKSIFNTDIAKPADVYGEIQREADGGALMAQWKMTYDFDSETFICNTDLFVNVFGIVTGIISPSTGYAGRIDILFCPKEWHVFVGRPDYQLGLSVIGFLNIGGYFMMGENLPPPAPMPNGHTNIFPTVPVNGMGLGARLVTPDIHVDLGWLWFRAGMQAGFDILMYNVKNQTCKGKPKGIKGWYLSGQAYIYGYVSNGLRTVVSIPYPCCGGWDCCCLRRNKWCTCPCCGTCWSDQVINISMPDFTVDVYGTIQAANPTYLEGYLNICGIKVSVKAGSTSCN